MGYHSSAISWEDLSLTSLLIISFILWSERTYFLINKTECTFKKWDSFKIDLFLISFSFLSGELLSFLFQFNNSDIKGWWALALSFITAYGILFAFIYSLFAQLLKIHRKYTHAFFFIIIINLVMINFLASIMPNSFFAKSNFFYVVTGLLISFHMLMCLTHSREKKRGKDSSSRPT